MKKNKGFLFLVALATMAFTSCSSDNSTTGVPADQAASSTETGPLAGPMKAIDAKTPFTGWEQSPAKSIKVSGLKATCTLDPADEVPRAELSDGGFWQQAGASTVTIKGKFTCNLAKGKTTGCGCIVQIINHVTPSTNGGNGNQANIFLVAVGEKEGFKITGNNHQLYVHPKTKKVYGDAHDIVITIVNDKNCRKGALGKVYCTIDGQSFKDGDNDFYDTKTQGDLGAAIKVGAYSMRSGHLTDKDPDLRYISGTVIVENLSVTRK